VTRLSQAIWRDLIAAVMHCLADFIVGVKVMGAAIKKHRKKGPNAVRYFLANRFQILWVGTE
jgi:hypothetical protein